MADSPTDQAEAEVHAATPKTLTCTSGPLSLASVLGTVAAEECTEASSPGPHGWLPDEVAGTAARHTDSSIEADLAMDTPTLGAEESSSAWYSAKPDSAMVDTPTLGLEESCTRWSSAQHDESNALDCKSCTDCGTLEPTLPYVSNDVSIPMVVEDSHATSELLPSSLEQATSSSCVVERELSHEVASVQQNWDHVSSGIEELRAELAAAMAEEPQQPQPQLPQMPQLSQQPEHLDLTGQCFADGSHVEYFSGSRGGWFPAVVLGWNTCNSTYILDIQGQAAPSNVRAVAAVVSDASEQIQEPQPQQPPHQQPQPLHDTHDTAEEDGAINPISTPRTEMGEDDQDAAVRRESVDSLLSQPESAGASEGFTQQDSPQSQPLASCQSFRIGDANRGRQSLATQQSFRIEDSNHEPSFPSTQSFRIGDSKCSRSKNGDSQDPWADYNLTPTETDVSSQRLLACQQAVSSPPGSLPSDPESVYDRLHALRLQTVNTQGARESSNDEVLYSDVGGSLASNHGSAATLSETKPPTPVAAADLLRRGGRVKAVWDGDGAYYDAVISKMNADGTVVVDWLRPAPLSKENLTCVLGAGGDDTLYRIVSLDKVVPVIPVEAHSAPAAPQHREQERRPVRPHVASRTGIDDAPLPEIPEDEPLPEVPEEEEMPKAPCDSVPHPPSEQELYGPQSTSQPASEFQEPEQAPNAQPTRAEAPAAKRMGCMAMPGAKGPESQKSKASAKPRKRDRAKVAGSKVAEQAYKWWQDTVANPFAQFSENVAGIFDSTQEDEDEDEEEEEEEEEAEENEDGTCHATDSKDVETTQAPISAPSPTFDIDWNALTQGGSSAPPPCAPFRPLPVNHEAYKWLHDSVAVPTLRISKDLPTSYQRFKEANDLHIMVHKRPSAEALYNMVVCLCLSIDRCIASNGRDVIPRLPPLGLYPPAQLVEMRLDLAIATLTQAVDAGYTQASAFFIDPDIKALRPSREAQLAALAQRAQASSAQQAWMPQPGSLATISPTLQANAAGQAYAVQGGGYQAGWSSAMFPRTVSTSSSQSTQSTQSAMVTAMRQMSLGSTASLAPASGSSMAAAPPAAAGPPAAKVLGIQTLPPRLASEEEQRTILARLTGGIKAAPAPPRAAAAAGTAMGPHRA